MSAPVQSLFITLKRSFAGTREHHVRILQGLGLRYRQQTVQQPNKEHVRGAINKVRHLLLVETDQQRAARLAAEAAAKAPRPPLVVRH
ncbi:ribosomal L30 family [Micractinium conductrix]|uniref:Large ribosomal subunit protein uL30m n=1 Tax=Micractinium conductrix TaxID=554055 RepID=A0A2P6V1Q9_9CHLO|nr:ribosomal L30 family [Micractinium conductrix]|eukprot:PSC68015.1 ribosomal L30 family [Micractinium conductrix]